MSAWKNIKIEGIARIEKCVGEFQVWELKKTPYGKFKVRIFEREDGKFGGFTNLRVRNSQDGTPESGVGFGYSIEEALEDTLNNFMELLSERDEFTEEDFEWAHPDDF